MTTKAFGRGLPLLSLWALSACGGAASAPASSGAASGLSSGEQSGYSGPTPSGSVSTGFFSSGVSTGFFSSGVSTGVSTGFFSSGVSTGVSTGFFSSGVSTGMSTGFFSSGVSTGFFSSGVSTGVSSGGSEFGIIWDGGAPTVGGVCVGAAVDSGVEGTPASADAGACGCTRRPGPANSFQCPMGVGEEVIMTLDATGGDVILQGRQGTQGGGPADIAFPPTALATSTTIALIETTIAPPTDLIDWSPVYRVEPLGLVLGAATPVKVPMSNLYGLQTEAVGVWFSPDGTCFTRLSDSFASEGIVEASLHQLGYFIAAEQRSAQTADCP
jgi:hypothetical protein